MSLFSVFLSVLGLSCFFLHSIDLSVQVFNHLFKFLFAQSFVALGHYKHGNAVFVFVVWRLGIWIWQHIETASLVEVYSSLCQGIVGQFDLKDDWFAYGVLQPLHHPCPYSLSSESLTSCKMLNIHKALKVPKRYEACKLLIFVPYQKEIEACVAVHLADEFKISSFVFGECRIVQLSHKLFCQKVCTFTLRV